MKDLDLTATDDKGKPIYSLDSYAKVIVQLTDLVEKLNTTENKLYSTMSEDEKVRGNVEKSMFVRFGGNVMLFKLEQSLKALPPIDVTLFGILILSSPVHPSKALLFMMVSPSGIWIELSRVQFLKADAPISVT